MATASGKQGSTASLLFLASAIAFIVFLLALGSDGTPVAPAAPSATEAGQEGPQIRVRKHVADQRIAELQAMAALARNAQIVYGHGQVDPDSIGRRKRIGGKENEARGHSNNVNDSPRSNRERRKWHY